MIWSTINGWATLESIGTFSVVDDEPAIQRISVRWLETAGYAYHVTSTAAGARELPDREPFAMALLAIHFGDESGLALAPRI